MLRVKALSGKALSLVGLGLLVVGGAKAGSSFNCDQYLATHGAPAILTVPEGKLRNTWLHALDVEIQRDASLKIPRVPNLSVIDEWRGLRVSEATIKADVEDVLETFLNFGRGHALSMHPQADGWAFQALPISFDRLGNRNRSRAPARLGAKYDLPALGKFISELRRMGSQRSFPKYYPAYAEQLSAALLLALEVGAPQAGEIYFQMLRLNQFEELRRVFTATVDNQALLTLARLNFARAANNFDPQDRIAGLSEAIECLKAVQGNDTQRALAQYLLHDIANWAVAQLPRLSLAAGLGRLVRGVLGGPNSAAIPPEVLVSLALQALRATASTTALEERVITPYLASLKDFDTLAWLPQRESLSQVEDPAARVQIRTLTQEWMVRGHDFTPQFLNDVLVALRAIGDRNSMLSWLRFLTNHGHPTLSASELDLWILRFAVAARHREEISIAFRRWLRAAPPQGYEALQIDQAVLILQAAQFDSHDWERATYSARVESAFWSAEHRERLNYQILHHENLPPEGELIGRISYQAPPRPLQAHYLKRPTFVLSAEQEEHHLREALNAQDPSLGSDVIAAWVKHDADALLTMAIERMQQGEGAEARRLCRIAAMVGVR